MKPNIQQFLSGGLVPVLLGDHTDTVNVARDLHRQYSVLSHVFCRKPSLALRFCICIKLHVVHATKNEILLIHALLDFARQLDHVDRILCLIPCSRYYARLMQNNRAELEPYYIMTEQPCSHGREKGETDV